MSYNGDRLAWMLSSDRGERSHDPRGDRMPVLSVGHRFPEVPVHDPRAENGRRACSSRGINGAFRTANANLDKILHLHDIDPERSRQDLSGLPSPNCGAGIYPRYSLVDQALRRFTSLQTSLCSQTREGKRASGTGYDVLGLGGQRDSERNPAPTAFPLVSEPSFLLLVNAARAGFRSVS
nr:hypothetical protein [Nonomuraea basaltis]